MKNSLKPALLALTLLTGNLYAASIDNTDNIDTNELYNEVIAESEETLSYTALREGWFGGIGIGGHATSFDLDNYTSKQGIASSLKLGYNFTEQWAVHYTRNAAWYSAFKDNYVSGIMGIGATYYFLPKQETWYTSVVVGVGDHLNLDKETSVTGTALMGTVGYEFAAHWQAEASLMYTDIEDKNDVTLKTTSLQFTINYSWY